MEPLPRWSEKSSQEIAADMLVKKALAVIELKYGENGAEPKIYHGPEHTKNVIEAVYDLAQAALAAGRITAEQLILLVIAGAFHDIVQSSEPDKSEELSAELAATSMRSMHVFTEDDIEQVRRMIAATKVRAIDENGIHRMVEDDFYPGKLLADADLSSLAGPVDHYWEWAQRFFAETHPGQQLEGEVLKRFIENQIVRVSSHKLYTEEARQIFNHQTEILEFLNSLLASI